MKHFGIYTVNVNHGSSATVSNAVIGFSVWHDAATSERAQQAFKYNIILLPINNILNICTVTNV